MKKYIILLFLLFSLSLQANRMVYYEYWIDDNYAGKISGNINQENALFQLRADYDLSGLSPGIHVLNYRFKDSLDNWSVLNVHLFTIPDDTPEEKYNSNKMAYFEYWIDDNYAGRTSGNINPLVELEQLRNDMDLTGLEDGIHTFNIRFRDSLGKWSIVNSSNFYKPIPKDVEDPGYQSNKMAYFEYWIDDNYAGKTSGNINPLVELEQLRTNMDLSGLEDGIHSFNIRFRDSIGKWSVCNISNFVKPAPKEKEDTLLNNRISAYRFWFDNDKNTLFTVQLDEPVINLDNILKIQTPNFGAIAQHLCTMQFLDTSGKWSVAVTDTFLFDGFYLNRPDLISPVNNTYINSDSSLKWAIIPYVDAYDLMVAKDNQFTDVVLNLEDLTQNIQGVNLTQKTKYYWKVRAKLDAIVSEWSDVWAFTTRAKPDLGESSIVSFNSQKAVISSQITSDNGAGIAARGVCWSEDELPDLTDNKTTDGSGTGTFQSTITGLQKDTKYYVRSYATNSIGTTYSNELTFTTPDVEIQEIDMSSGWNMISSYIIPQEPDSMQYIFDAIKNQLVIVKNNIGEVFIPQFGINSIGKWNKTQGYQTYLSSSATLEITGVPCVPATDVIPLKSGWNMISYIRSNNLDAPLAFVSITDNGNLVIAKDQKGNVYIPSFGINSLGLLKPGNGYRVYVTNNDTLVYPDN